MEEKDMLEIVDIRDATEEEIKEYTRKQESPEWQQRMMQVFLHRPKCHPDYFGAASNDCGRCSG
ncbi:unknown [Blautia sp. CAG:52]|nr:unknown [Blautia sp. CAG:52]